MTYSVLSGSRGVSLSADCGLVSLFSLSFALAIRSDFSKQSVKLRPALAM